MGVKGKPGVPGGLTYITDEELNICWLFQDNEEALTVIVKLLETLNNERERRIKGEYYEQDKDR